MFGCNPGRIRKYLLVVINIYYIILASSATFGMYCADGFYNRIVPDNH